MDRNLLLHTYRLMYSVSVMAETYEANRPLTKYVHSTSRGHEAIQLAAAALLRFVGPRSRRRGSGEAA